MSRVCWLFLMLSLVTSTALAQDAADKSAGEQRAGEHFERGVQLFKEQAYRAAIVEFQRAYDLAPDYRLLYNLARAKQQLQDYLGASQDYESYLVKGGSEIQADRRTQVEETLTQLRGRVARIHIKVNRTGAEVFVDDSKVGVEPLASLVPTSVGRHRVSARTTDGALGAQVIDVAGGDIAEVELVLSEPERKLASTTEAARNDASPGWSAQRKVGLVGWIVGGSLLATSVATGVMALHNQDELKSQVGMLGVAPSSVADQRDKVDTLSLTTDVLIGAGAALVAAGTIFWLVSPDHAEHAAAARASLRLNVGLGSVALGGRF